AVRSGRRPEWRHCCQVWLTERTFPPVSLNHATPVPLGEPDAVIVLLHRLNRSKSTPAAASSSSIRSPFVSLVDRSSPWRVAPWQRIVTGAPTLPTALITMPTPHGDDVANGRGRP